MRAGDTDRQIAQQQLLGRPKAAEFRELASRHGWLQASVAMPRDETIASALEQQPAPQPKSISSVAPWREQIATWVSAGVQTTAIHAALKREHGFAGHYSSVRRMVEQVRQQICPLMSEAAQLDVPLRVEAGVGNNWDEAH